VFTIAGAGKLFWREQANALIEGRFVECFADLSLIEDVADKIGVYRYQKSCSAPERVIV
jgi:hypothetical protein